MKRIPNMMAYEVSRDAMLVYAFLLDDCDDLGVCEAVYGSAFNAALYRPQIDAALKELEDGGYIEIFPQLRPIAEFPGKGRILGNCPGCRLLHYPVSQRIDRLGQTAWAELRASIFERDDYTCVYCRERGGKLECDHVIPLAKGGTNEPGNLVTACATCNKAKRDKLLSDWKKKNPASVETGPPGSSGVNRTPQRADCN